MTRHRAGEKKIGEAIAVVEGNWEHFAQNSNAIYFILGVPEDIGIRANHGRAGASSAVRPAFDAFLNQQDNPFVYAGQICLLGELRVEDLMQEAETLDAHNEWDVKRLRELTAEVDERLSFVIQKLVSLQKFPVIIGGGHNNAYGNLKGCALALGKPVNAINCDPHLDFRPVEGRHSGNGFSYAFGDGYLGSYAVLGMHEQYNSLDTLLRFRDEPGRLFFHSFESIFIREEITFSKALSQCIGFVKAEACGIEIDLDSVTNVPSSARTSSGITALQARQYVHLCASQLKPLYLHVAEGAPVLSHIRADNKTGKLIAYIVTDFIKACVNRGH